MTEEERKQHRREYQKRYRESHKEKIAASNKAYREAHKEDMKKWRENNKERYRQYYLNGREKIITSIKKWQNTPIGRANHLLQTYNQYDLLNRGCVGDLTAEWIVENIFSKPCAHCGETDWHKIGCNRLDNSKPHTMDNVEPCCKPCNSKMYGKSISKQVFQYALDGELVAVWDSSSEAANTLGIDRSSIRQCCQGKLKTYKKHRWSYESL